MVDECLAPLLQALNDAGIPTSESCCGHGEKPSQIFFAPGPSGIRFSAYGCCGESWSVSLSWTAGKFLGKVIQKEKEVLAALEEQNG